jgi:hypothetical protein
MAILMQLQNDSCISYNKAQRFRIINKLIIFFISIFILNFIVNGQTFDTFIDPDKKYSQQLPVVPQIVSGGSSSRGQMALPAEIAPLNITWRILHPKRVGSFFTDDVLEVLVKATSMQEENLGHVEIWQIPGEDLTIKSCSYPIRTSSIGQILDYEVHDKSYLLESDIQNISAIKNLLISKKEPYAHIYKLMSANTTEILNESLLNKSSFDKNLTKYILNDFNKLIECDSNTDLNSSFLIAYNISLSFPNTNSLNSNYEDNNMLNDHRLVKRRLLESLFPGMLKKLSFYREHEDFKFDDSSNSINIIERDLYQDESVILKYYLKAQKPGFAEIRSIIRSKGFLYEQTIPLNIVEREPLFKYDYWIGSKELTLNTPAKFDYYITYLGGDDTNKSFIAKIIAPEFCIIDDEKEKTQMINLSIGKGINFSVNARYNKTGSTYSPPIIAIGRSRSFFPEDIKVYTEEQKNAKIGYEKLSLDLIRYSLLIAVIAAIIAILEIYSMHKNQKRNDIKINSILIAHEEVIAANNSAMIALRSAIALPHISSERSVESCCTQQYLDDWTKPEYYP